MVYRPPDGDLSITETFLRKIISENTKVQNFVNRIFEFSMIPIINKPARVTTYTATAIDNIITSSIFDNHFESAIIKTDVSDHFPIIFTIKLKTANLYTNVILTKIG